MIAITGYTGFVGRHLLECLQKNIENNTQNNQQCNLQNKLQSNTKNKAQKEPYLLLGRDALMAQAAITKEKSTQPSNQSTGHLDLQLLATGDPKHLSELEAQLQDVSILVHLAAKVHQMPSTKNSSVTSDHEYIEMNANATINLARCALNAGVKRFIFMSTIKVNGEETTSQSFFSHSDKPNPSDPYGHSKALAEKQLQQLAVDTDLELVIIRPPLVYGAGVKANFAALMKFVRTKRVNPFAMIKQNKRSFVSVYNLCDFIQTCISHPSLKNETFLVSDDQDLSTSRLIQLLALAQGTKALPIPIPAFVFSLMGRIFRKKMQIIRLTGSLRVDVSHAKNHLAWTPPYTVEQSLQLMNINRNDVNGA